MHAMHDRVNARRSMIFYSTESDRSDVSGYPLADLVAVAAETRAIAEDESDEARFHVPAPETRNR